MKSLITCPKFNKNIKIFTIYLNGTITVNMFLVTSKSIGCVKQKSMSCLTFLVPFLACSKAISFLLIIRQRKRDESSTH